MNRASNGMRSLCEDIKVGHEDREKSIKKLKEDAGAIRDNARKFLRDSKQFHEQMSKDLKEGLQEQKENLVKNMNALREDFKKKEEETKADLDEARRIWNKTSAILKEKRNKV